MSARHDFRALIIRAGTYGAYLGLMLVLLLGAAPAATAARTQLRFLEESEQNYIGGTLPRIVAAQPWAENCTQNPCTYPFKFIFTRVSQDKAPLRKAPDGRPTGAFMYGNMPRLKDMFSFCPGFGDAASRVFPVLNNQVVPPLRFTVSYQLGFFEVVNAFGSWVPASGVNYLMETPLSVEKWAARSSGGSRQVVLHEYRQAGFAPGTYKIKVWALATLDQKWAEKVAKKLAKEAGVPSILCTLAGWAAEQATQGQSTYLLRVPGKVPQIKGTSCYYAPREIRKRALEPVYSGPGRKGKVVAQSPAAGTWLWKGSEVRIRCESGTPTPPAAVTGIVGKWKWFTGSTVTIKPGGKVESSSGNTGRWSGSGNTYEIHWVKGDYHDTLTLSRDGRRLHGKNQNDTTVWGERK